MDLVLANTRQHLIADLLWAAETEQDVLSIVRQFGHDALVVREMMVAAAMDEDMGTDLAEAVLRGF